VHADDGVDCRGGGGGADIVHSEPMWNTMAGAVEELPVRRVAATDSGTSGSACWDLGVE
jgi:hypothetical protein